MKHTSIISMTVALALCVMPMLTGCGDKDKDPSAPTPTPTMSPELSQLTSNTISAVITLSNGDEINLELYPDLAPKTVENFVELANDGVYDGTIFHRVIEGFMIQAGGYDEDLKEIKADSIDGEFEQNGFKNELSHVRGVISMARRGNDMDSASSQFFIVQENSEYLDGQYAAFGRVTDEESLTVVDDIAAVRTGSVSSLGLDDVPVSPVVIKSITVGSSGSANPAGAAKKSLPDDEFDINDDEDLGNFLKSIDDGTSTGTPKPAL